MFVMVENRALTVRMVVNWAENLDTWTADCLGKGSKMGKKIELLEKELKMGKVLDRMGYSR